VLTALALLLGLHASHAQTSLHTQRVDGYEKDRTTAGITNSRVFRSADDQNDVVILTDVANVPKARAWLGSNDMKTVFEKSGVVGSPSIRFAA
jgi:hypothetical protein